MAKQKENLNYECGWRTVFDTLQGIVITCEKVLDESDTPPRYRMHQRERDHLRGRRDAAIAASKTAGNKLAAWGKEKDGG